MAPTKMKLRARRRESGAAPRERAEEVEVGGGEVGVGGVQGSSSKKPPFPPVVSGDEEASPDSKCPICLDRFNNLAYLDHCLHRFCFPCIHEWSHNKAECPLCKQAFTSILHSVRSHDDFKKYTVRPRPQINGILAAGAAMVAAYTRSTAAPAMHEEEPPQRRRRRRRRWAELEAGDGGASRRERGGGGSRSRERQREVESGLPLPSMASSSPDSPQLGAEEVRREEPGDRGVLFEGLTGLAEGPVAPDLRSSRRLMSRLSERLRLMLEGTRPPRLREREMLAFRQALYRSGVRALEGTRFQLPLQRDVSVEALAGSPGHLGWLRPWLRRELTVLYGAHGSLVDIVQRIITSRIRRHGLESTRGLEDELRPFLLARTQHFLHELACFARSELSMERYDSQVVYEPLGPAYSHSSSQTNQLHSSVIAISEGEEPIDQTESLLGLSARDEEPPGPSYSTAEPAPFLPPASPRPEAPEPANRTLVGAGGEEECLIVGYVKPMAERTPELVQLSSDTEEEEEEEEQREKPDEEEDKKESVLPPLLFLHPPLTELVTPASGALTLALSCSSCSPSLEQERESSLLSHSPGGLEGGRRKKKRRRCALISSIYSRLDLPRSRSSSSSQPRSPSSPDASSPWECPPSRHPMPPSSSSPCPPKRHGDKPGGKRKYKSRHLDAEEDPTWTPGSGCRGDALKERGGVGGEKRAEKRGRERGRRRERERRRNAHKHNSVCDDQSSSSSGRGEGGHRSPSVEIVYEGKVGSSAPFGNKRLKKRCRHGKHQHNSSPVVITIDSQSSPDDGSHGDRLPMFADLGNRQPIDFSASEIPSLPLVEPGGLGGSLGAQTDELPVHILARGSDCSDMEPNNQSKTSGGLAVDIMDDDDDDDKQERVTEEERGASNGERDENRLLATILDEIAQLTPGTETRPLDGTHPLKWYHPLRETHPPSEICLPAWSFPASETRPLYMPLPPSDPRQLEWTHPPTVPRPLDKPHPLKWSLPPNETNNKQEMAANRTTALPVCSSNTTAPSSSAEAPPTGLTSLVVMNCDVSTSKPCPDRESCTSPFV
ncbi:hypothetical protein NHX12_013996 [Muraenolepis orangiensis]|uniref:E3 ubiquitin-protein ligase Topors n=1 Tax=Muraenolepis orangiensis TaxID=630683 RepID=A0A9Q0DE13_9TELE|nr:hypothetical protein NHX12_013996 [Muraenolepis orangiensis]